jgi:hypothetical protein
MKARKVDGMVEYHFGLGMWMRNNWGLWSGSRLAKWFAAKGVHHPDDMSGIILGAYWAHLHHQPYDLPAQVRRVQAYWIEEKDAAAAEELRAAKAERTIQGMMMGLTVSATGSHAVVFPPMPDDSFRARYAAAFANGVLLTAKRFSAQSIRQDPDYFIRTYFLELPARTLHPVEVPEGDTVEDSVVVAGRAYLNCLKGGQGRILEVEHPRRTWIPWPKFAGTSRRPVRLGIERDAQGTAVGLLAVGARDVARWTDGRWVSLYTSKSDLPLGAVPVEKVGRLLNFRDEGSGEDRKGFFWIDLDRPGPPVRFDRHVGVVGPNGPRWENVWDYAYAPNGDCWIATGSNIGSQSLLRRTPAGAYRVAVYQDSVEWTKGLLGHGDSRRDTPEHALAVTGLAASPEGGIDAIGPHGLFTLRDGKIQRRFRFLKTPQDWLPSELLFLGPDRFLAGGHFGGLVLIEYGPRGSYEAYGLDGMMANVLKY